MSTEIGRRAEEAAVHYLTGQGYEIIDQNWRTRWCEIDIVAQKRQVVSFVEVKYRSKDTQGTGLDYITPRKLTQMHFAAEFWMAKEGSDRDYRLAVCEVMGSQFAVTAWIDDIT